MNPPWALDPDTDCMKDFIEVMHEQFSPEAFRKLYSNTTMENQQRTTDDQATEYAAGVAKVCEDNGNPLPIEFIHLLETAYVAGYNHVCENNKEL